MDKFTALFLLFLMTVCCGNDEEPLPIPNLMSEEFITCDKGAYHYKARPMDMGDVYLCKSEKDRRLFAALSPTWFDEWGIYLLESRSDRSATRIAYESVSIQDFDFKVLSTLVFTGEGRNEPIRLQGDELAIVDYFTHNFSTVVRHE